MDWLQELRAQGDHQARLQDDLEYFAGQMLKIRPKAGGLEPLLFNPAQRELHRRLEEQKAKTGMVRAVVLKARQMGISTYIAARFFKRTIHNPGLRTIIMAHERPASGNLFKLVKRFADHMPDEFKPVIGTNNAQELIFDRIDSGYAVTVATEEGSGRSDTAQSLHASEAAFWKNLKDQIAALMQTVPEMPGTEIIFETTANSFNEFHSFWRDCEKGLNGFMPVFLPWSIEPGYAAPLPDGFVMTPEERGLADLHKLTAEQIAWRRTKIATMGDLFAQEYPLIASEAFIASSFDSFIPPDIVLRARREEIEPYGPLIIGVDPAGKGADRTSVAWRQGHCITKIESRRGLDTMEVTGWIAKIIREEKPAKVNIDVGGLGIGVYDRLVEQGFIEVQNVNFGGKPIDPPPLDENGKPTGGPHNRRAELWENMRTALQGRFSIPDRDELQADLTSTGYGFNSEGRLVLESKEKMRQRGVPSPDEADAMALCFSEPEGSPIPRSMAMNWNRRITYPGSAYA